MANSHHHHDHTHDHSHGHGHSHGDVSTADGRRRVAIAGLLTGCFMMAEVVGGVISGSLALLADAAHMLTDTASLALAWIGYRLAARPADDTRNFGFSRMRVLAAFTNGLALLALSVWILVEGVQRLLSPSDVMGSLMLAVAAVGLIVNLIAFAVLHGGDRGDLNLSGALWHVAGDLLGSVAAIAAALVIMATGWMPIDPILSMLVAGLVGVAGWRITRRSGHILVEGAPDGLTPKAVSEDLIEHVKGLVDVSHIHTWSLTEKQPMVTLEALPEPGMSPQEIRLAIKDRLAKRFGVTHTTVEILDGEAVSSSKSAAHSAS
ncbi:MAG: cation diffusion facilitator family transporter [Pseudomonadota bacterium]